MKQLGRILLNAVTVLSLLSCAVTVAIWLKARRAYPSAAWASGDKTLHVAAHSGTIWVTRTQGWSDGAGARKAAAAAPAARPVVLRPHFPSLARAMEDQRQRLIQALRELPRLGARDPGSRSCLSLGAAELEAQMTVLVEEMKTSLRDDAVARAGGRLPSRCWRRSPPRPDGDWA